MNKIFVDTDVILDLLAQRIPHFHFSAVLFTFAEMKKLELLQCTPIRKYMKALKQLEYQVESSIVRHFKSEVLAG